MRRRDVILLFVGATVGGALVPGALATRPFEAHAQNAPVTYPDHPITLIVPYAAGGGIDVRRGIDEAAAHVRLAPGQFEDLVDDQQTFMAWFSSGRLDQPSGRLEDLLDWWVVLRAVIDERPIYTPGSISLRAPDGAPLELGRSFRPDDDPAEMKAFLEEEARDLLAVRTGLVGHQRPAEQFLGRCLGRLGRLDDLDAAGLTAPAGVNLGFDDDDARAQAAGNFVDFLGGKRHLATRYGHTIPGEDGLGLILVNFHDGNWDSGR